MLCKEGSNVVRKVEIWFSNEWAEAEVTAVAFRKLYISPPWHDEVRRPGYVIAGILVRAIWNSSPHSSITGWEDAAKE